MKRYYSSIVKTRSAEAKDNEPNLVAPEPEISPTLDSIMQSADTPQHDSSLLLEEWKQVWRGHFHP
ncbi:hypothetical protein LINGRAHAP2_LOCUS4213 [Linum grandiflorum]